MAEGLLYYIKDVGTLEQDNVTDVLMRNHEETTWVQKQLNKTA